MKNISLLRVLKPFSPWISFVVAVLSSSFVLAGEWRVTPIRMELDKNAKSGVVTIANEGTDKLNVQLKAMEWTQDAEGKDVYTETEDLIFFPKIMTIDPHEDRIVRAGIKVPAVAREKTYRLFVEEIPEPKKSEGVNVAIAIRFGVPIFVRPVKSDAKGEVHNIGLAKGVASVTVRNTGNVHFMINTVSVRGKNDKGEEIFAKDINGWYLLSGVSRVYGAEIPDEVCKGLSKIEVHVVTDKLTLDGHADVESTMCLN